MQYDLRDATRAEVFALWRANDGRICAQLRTGPAVEPKLKPRHHHARSTCCGARRSP